MPIRQANIKRNSIQTLTSCIPGCFRLAQKYFVRIEDVVPTHGGATPVYIDSPGSIGAFSINRVSWTYIWNEIHPRGVDRDKRILPIIADNRFIGHITLSESMHWCPQCWDYFPKDSHTEHRAAVRKIRYMQNPARVNCHLVPEFSAGSLFQILNESSSIDFQHKKEILNIFNENEDEFDSLVISIIEKNTSDPIEIITAWYRQYPQGHSQILRKLREELGEYIQGLIDWALANLSDEGFKQITHSAEVAGKEGKRIYLSNTLFINYSTDMNIIRYVYDLERCPIGEQNRHNTRFNEIDTLPFRNQGIDCIAASSQVECLIISFNENINRLTTHTYLHALTLFLSKEFKISKDIISHYIYDNFSLIFINQPINLGLLASIDENHIRKFHTEYCNGEINCTDRGVCPGACHHCLHFPYFACSEPDNMERLNWGLLGANIEW